MKKKVVHYSMNNVEKITIDRDIADKYVELKKRIAELEMELKPIEDVLKEELKDAMESIGENKFNNYGIVASIKSGYTKKTFDTTQFKTDRPNMYEKYLVEKIVGSTLSMGVE